MILALLLMMSAVEDPRVELIQLQLEGETLTALEQVDRILGEGSTASDSWGLDYLRGHLLEELGDSEAAAAFADALSTTPTLAAFSRYRLARSQLQMGHPEVAAGLLATILANQPPESLIPTSVQLLSDSLSQGGDCRLLSSVEHWRLPADEMRPIQIAEARCALKSGELDDAERLATSLLKQSREDEAARGAALVLADLVADSADAATQLRIGLTFHQHREFDRAVPFLTRGIEIATQGGTGLPSIDRADALYELARAQFWLADYPTAAATFSRAAAGEPSASKQARAYFQQGRCWELAGQGRSALESYRRSFQITPTSSWTPAALVSAVRVEWRQGSEAAAIDLISRLRSRGSWQKMASRALLFAAASDIVRGRSDRAGEWLEAGLRTLGSKDIEIAYWTGRLAELETNRALAVQRYSDVLMANSYHPLATAARERLTQPELSQQALHEGETLATSVRSSDWLEAWLLLGSSHPAGLAARDRLVSYWTGRAEAKPFLTVEVISPEAWTIWQDSADRPEDLLLKLGIVEQMSPSLSRHFPRSDIPLALTASRLLSTSGLYKPSLFLAEVSADRIPNGLPSSLLPLGVRQLLYPQPYRRVVDRESRRHHIDSNLLNAIIREESRFDPLAISAASARGLTQFVLPTARRVAESLEWGRLEAVDLHRPEVAIALGAAYLAELEALFEGRVEPAIAAYNAGENQAGLWLSYCYSREPEEYFTKVGFTQTRNYLGKVGSSRAQYREIYGPSQSRAGD